MTQPETIVRQQLLDTHRETLTAVVEVGRLVAQDQSDGKVPSDSVVSPMEQLLSQRGLVDDLLELLSTGADAIGEMIQAPPVAAPPYLVSTSRGPLCRATLSNGSRLVIELNIFVIDRETPQYRIFVPDVENALTVYIR